MSPIWKDSSWQASSSADYKRIIPWMVWIALALEAVVIMWSPHLVFTIPVIALIGMTLVALVRDAVEDAMWDQHAHEFDRYHESN